MPKTRLGQVYFDLKVVRIRLTRYLAVTRMIPPDWQMVRCIPEWVNENELLIRVRPMLKEEDET